MRKPENWAVPLAAGLVALATGFGAFEAWRATSTGTVPAAIYWWMWIGGVVLGVSGVGWLVTVARQREDIDAAPTVMQGDITESNLLNNLGTIQAGHDVIVGQQPRLSEPQPPSVDLRVSDDCCWLSLTNNDLAEHFLVEVSEFMQGSGLKLRPRRQDGAEVGTLKRGEQVWVSLLCVEPDRPRIINTTVGAVVSRLTYPPWKDRNDRGVRLVRFHGEPSKDIEIPVNTGGSFLVSVLSDRQEPVVGRYTYGVTEHSRLVMPFDTDAIRRINAAELAKLEASTERLKELANSQP